MLIAPGWRRAACSTSRSPWPPPALPVFPCNADKRPAIPKAKGGNGFHDASTDPDRIRELWDLAGPAAQLVGVANRRRQRLRRARFRSAPRFG